MLQCIVKTVVPLLAILVVPPLDNGLRLISMAVFDFMAGK